MKYIDRTEVLFCQYWSRTPNVSGSEQTLTEADFIDWILNAALLACIPHAQSVCLLYIGRVS